MTDNQYSPVKGREGCSNGDLAVEIKMVVRLVKQQKLRRLG